jgi:hypothetical protein
MQVELGGAGNTKQGANASGIRNFDIIDHLSRRIIEKKPPLIKIAKKDHLIVAAGLSSDTWHLPPVSSGGTSTDHCHRQSPPSLGGPFCAWGIPCMQIGYVLVNSLVIAPIARDQCFTLRSFFF